MNIIVFALSKRYIINGTLDSDEMTVIQTIIIEGYSNISGYMTSIWRIRKAIASLRSVYSILDTPSLICPFKKDNLDKISANNIKGKIEFRNVYFAYPFQPEHVILKNISFTILPGQKVALVGNSGCGKSSVIQLINRFYDVEDGKGEILIDDINIKDYNLYELKKKIGFVQQEPSAFKRSNLENIRYGSLEATDEECYEAAKKVNALNLLEIDKMQNLKKQNLSGGDKQKLAIGRIFLKNPPILLLDEPTSNLDKDSKVEIEKSLEILAENKTTITIAHRLNTIENCDKIIVFDDGRIKEEGTHEELMKLKKRYYTLYKFSNLS
jgi:ABC-type multidrug transport system fused ATPase/permease subunit